jgi:hypothetical protein
MTQDDKQRRRALNDAIHSQWTANKVHVRPGMTRDELNASLHRIGRDDVPAEAHEPTPDPVRAAAGSGDGGKHGTPRRSAAEELNDAIRRAMGGA